MVKKSCWLGAVYYKDKTILTRKNKGDVDIPWDTKPIYERKETKTTIEYSLVRLDKLTW